MHRRFICGATILALACPANASAQETRERPPPPALPAPSNTFELKMGTGYTQGFGKIAPGRGIPNAAGAGIGASLDADYRIDPSLSIGVATQYQQFTPQNGKGSFGVAFDIGATYHFSPEKRGDFWGRFGAGYRMLWDVHPAGDLGITDVYHGITLATLKLGYDFRATSDIAIAPVVGADLQSFLFKDADAFVSPQWGTFVYAGVQGRFDPLMKERSP